MLPIWRCCYNTLDIQYSKATALHCNPAKVRQPRSKMYPYLKVPTSTFIKKKTRTVVILNCMHSAKQFSIILLPKNLEPELGVQ